MAVISVLYKKYKKTPVADLQLEINVNSVSHTGNRCNSSSQLSLGINSQYASSKTDHTKYGDYKSAYSIIKNLTVITNAS